MTQQAKGLWSVYSEYTGRWSGPTTLHQARRDARAARLAGLRRIHILHADGREDMGDA